MSGSGPQLPPQLRRLVLLVFTKKYSLQLHSSALTFVAQTLADHDLLHIDESSEDDKQQQKDAIEMLAKGCLDLGVLEETAGEGSIITAKQLAHVYQQLVAEGGAAGSSSATISNGQSSSHIDSILLEDEIPDPGRWFDVVDSFEMPRVEWDSVSKTFVKLPSKSSILPPALAKPLAIRQRLQALRALVLRNENFCPPLPGSTRLRGNGADTWMKLTSTSNLLGRPNGRFLLFGLLTTTPDGRLCLEDEDGRVELDVSNAIPGEGIFTLGSLLLVEGRYADEGEGEKFFVNAIGHPPSETRKRGKEMYGHIDWTGKGVINAKEEQSLSTALQTHHPDLSFVVLSDLHLDLPSTLHSLRAALQGYIDADFVPFLFIFCGNFLSDDGRRKADGSMGRYNDAFSALADLLSSFPTLFTQSHFLFIPGPSDPFPTPLLPRQALPNAISEPFLSRLSSKLSISTVRLGAGPQGEKRVVFGSNPCRVRFWGKEVVVYRDDVLNRMRRNCVPLGMGQEDGQGRDAIREGGMKKYLVSTILDQSHLSPLLQSARPILWEHDHTLRLYPLPSALVLADSSAEHFELTYEGCHVLNPGTFLSATVAANAVAAEGRVGAGGYGGASMKGAGWVTYYPAQGRGERSELVTS